MATGRKHSEETKRKLSEMARQRHAANPEHLQSMTEKAAELRRKGEIKISDETREKLSGANKRIFADPQERAKRAHMFTDEERQRISEERKSRSDNPEYIEKLRKSSTGRAKSEETKQKIAEKARLRWQNPEFKAKMVVINQEAAKNRDMSGAKKGMFGRKHTEETRRKQSEIRKQFCEENPEIMVRLSAAFKEKLKDPDFTERMMEHLQDIQSPTAIEIAVGKALDVLGAAYESQKVIGRCIVDYYLPEHNMVIECDGHYWHSLPKNKARDDRRDAWLRSQGYTVVRLTEEAIRQDPYSAVTTALQNNN